jgi:long-chain acyl-CoA synthetase
MPFPKRQLAPFRLRKDARREGKPWPPVPRGAPVLTWRQVMRSPSAAPPPAEVDAESDVAALVYTGGTTGLSKGAMLTHRNLVANAMQGAAWFLDPEDGREAILSVLPFFHCYGMTVCMNLGILLAAKLVLLPRFDVGAVMHEIEKERPSLFPGVPKIYSIITEAAEGSHRDLSSIKSCLSGAGALPSAIAERFHAVTGAVLVEGYGLTEASPIVAGNPLDGTGRPGTIGVPLPDTDCRITDLADPSREVPPGEQGELMVRGPQVMLGYRNRAAETETTILDGWLRTGDIAMMDEDGYFTIVDRLKDMIKVSGFNVYPSEVEEVLHNHPKIARACVVGVPDGQGGEMVKAFVVLSTGQEATAEEILAWCRDPTTGLTGYRVPKAIEFRDALPETLIGKVLRRVLLEEERERAAVTGR